MKRIEDCYLTYSTYDVKNFLTSHNDYYRVGYCKDIGLWMISSTLIHNHMISSAYKNGDLDDKKLVESTTDHLYYVPGAYTDSDFAIHFVEISTAAIYDGFVLGRANFSKVNYLQDFIDIFGEPLEIKQTKIQSRKIKKPSKIHNTKIEPKYRPNNFIEQARRYVPPMN